MKQREARQTVLIAARMRWEGHWLPASIRNITPHGMMACMLDPPPPGTYVEVQVGSATITGRAIWTLGQACGLHLRETLDLAAIKANRRSTAVRTAPEPAVRHAAQRMRAPALERHDDSRRLASLMQYATFAAIALSAACGLAWEVYQTISAPVITLENAFKPQLKAQASRPEQSYD